MSPAIRPRKICGQMVFRHSAIKKEMLSDEVESV